MMKKDKTGGPRKSSVNIITVDSPSDIATFRVTKTKSEPFITPHSRTSASPDNWVSHFVCLVDSMSLPYGYRDKLIDSVLTEKVSLSEIDEKYLSSIGISQLGLRKRIVNDLKSLIPSTIPPITSNINTQNTNNINNVNNISYSSNQNSNNNNSEELKIVDNPFQKKKKKKNAGDIDMKNISEWSNADVIKWLYINAFAEYIDSFILQSIDGEDLISIDDQKLKELGVQALGHRKKILKMIREMKGVLATPRDEKKATSFSLL